MRILGIETSCDETGVALYDTERGLLAHALFSQVDIHVEYGGVVPELASRDHVRKTLPLVEQVLADAGCASSDIDAVAYTAGPGLVGALMVGATLARALAWGWGVPALGVHHMEGHLLAPMLEDERPDFYLKVRKGTAADIKKAIYTGEDAVDYEEIGQTRLSTDVHLHHGRLEGVPWTVIGCRTSTSSPGLSSSGSLNSSFGTEPSLLKPNSRITAPSVTRRTFALTISTS